ncbi:MAG TPA: fibronectin type III domain-containing protein [Jatrophihabitantaceae bacterium]|nr:fibronectin type III domain-containing protein [Jatrophihabitantaceae bacterium]
MAVAALAILLSVGLVSPQEAGAAGTGAISTIAGSDSFGDFKGDGGPAIAAALNEPLGVAVMPDGGYLIADAGNDRVRRVFADGTIRTVAGTGLYGDSGDGGPATAAQIKDPLGVAVMPDGGFLIADGGAGRVRRVLPDGTITTVAGNGTRGYSGDGGPATAAEIFDPNGVAVLPDGGFLIADGDYVVRRVFPDGTITTVAGNATPGFSGDGGPATAARLNVVYSVAVTADGGFLIADSGNRRVRRVSPTGIITTVAGTGVQGSSGDGGAATAAQLNDPDGIASTPDGGFLIADFFGNRVRWVSPTGVITTVAGTGAASVFRDGDGGPATAANIDMPFGVAVTPSGGFVFSEEGNAAVRLVDAGFATAVPPSAPTFPGAPTIGSPTAGNASATVRWTAPSNDGGSAITGYLVRALDLSGAQVGALHPAAATATSLVVTGLTNGSTYVFQVAATNAVGTGPNSALTSLVVPATVPGAPVIGTAASGTAGGTVTATANWNAPASNGGSAVTGYVVRALQMSATGTVLATTTSAVQPASARQLTMTLPAGNYRFTVQAKNKAGSGSQSARSNLVVAR